MMHWKNNDNNQNSTSQGGMIVIGEMSSFNNAPNSSTVTNRNNHSLSNTSDKNPQTGWVDKAEILSHQDFINSLKF